MADGAPHPAGSVAMRFVALSDTHGLHAEPPVPEGDVLLFAGDHAGTGAPEEWWSFLAWLERLPHPHKIVIAGNHDLRLRLARYREQLEQSAVYLQDRSMEVGGVIIHGSPWTPFIRGHWPFEANETQRRESWAQISERTDIIVSHAPPLGVCDANRTDVLLGDPELTAMLREWPSVHRTPRPRVVVCGHAHEGFGEGELAGVRVLNVAICDDRYVAAHPVTIFDLERR